MKTKKLLSVIVAAAIVVSVFIPIQGIISDAGSDVSTYTVQYTFEDSDTNALTIKTENESDDVSDYKIITDPSDATNHVYSVGKKGAAVAVNEHSSIKKSMQVDIYVGGLEFNGNLFYKIGLWYKDFNNYRAFAFAMGDNGTNKYNPAANYKYQITDDGTGETKTYSQSTDWWCGDNGLKMDFDETRTWLTFRIEYSPTGKSTISWWERDNETVKRTNTIGNGGNNDVLDLTGDDIALFGASSAICYDNLEIEYYYTDEQIADNYLNKYSGIFATDSDKLTLDDMADVCNAANEYNAFSTSLKELIVGKSPAIETVLSAHKTAVQSLYWKSIASNNYTVNYTFDDAANMVIDGDSPAGWSVITDPTNSENKIFQAGTSGVAYPFNVSTDKLKKSAEFDIYVGGVTTSDHVVSFAYNGITDYYGLSVVTGNSPSEYNPKYYYPNDDKTAILWNWGIGGLKGIYYSSDDTWLTLHIDYTSEKTTISWWKKGDETTKKTQTLNKDLRAGTVAFIGSSNNPLAFDNLTISYYRTYEDEANEYIAAHSSIINRTDNITLEDKTAITNAINDYNMLSDTAKTYVAATYENIETKLDNLESAVQSVYWKTLTSKNDYTVKYDFESATDMIIEGKDSTGFGIVTDPSNSGNKVYKVGNKDTELTAAYPIDVSSSKQKSSMQVDIYVGEFPYAANENFSYFGLSYTDIKNWRAIGLLRYSNGSDTYNPKGAKSVDGKITTSWSWGDNGLKGFVDPNGVEWITFRAEYTDTSTVISMWKKGDESTKKTSTIGTSDDDIADLTKGFIALFNTSNGTLYYDNLEITYVADANDSAEYFKTKYSELLSKDTADIVKSDAETVFEAYSVYEALTDEAVALLGEDTVKKISEFKQIVISLVLNDEFSDNVLTDGISDSVLSEALWNNYGTLKISGDKIKGQNDKYLSVYANTAYGKNQVLASVSFKAKLSEIGNIGSDSSLYIYPIYAKNGTLTVRDTVSAVYHTPDHYLWFFSDRDDGMKTSSSDTDANGTPKGRGSYIGVNGWNVSGQYRILSAADWIDKEFTVTVNYDWSQYSESKLVKWYLRAEAIDDSGNPIITYVDSRSTTVTAAGFENASDFTFGFCSPTATLSDFRIVYSTQQSSTDAANAFYDTAVRDCFSMYPEMLAPYDKTRINYSYDLLSAQDRNIVLNEFNKISTLKSAIAKWDTTSDETIVNSFKTVTKNYSAEKKLNIYNRLTAAQKELLSDEYAEILGSVKSAGSNDDNITITCVGDSITEGCGGVPWVQGVYTTGWTKVMKAALGDNYTVVNRGVGGSSIYASSNAGVWSMTYSAMYTFLGDVESDIYTVMLGTNDQTYMSTAIREGKTEEAKAVIKEKLTDLVQGLLSQENNPTVVLATICRDGRSSETEESPKSIISQIIRDVADEYDLALVDINALTKTWENWTQYFAEWLHPNAEGHALIGAHFTSFIANAKTVCNNSSAAIFDFSDSEEKALVAPDALGATVAVNNVCKVKFGFDFTSTLAYIESANLNIKEYGAYVAAGNLGTVDKLTTYSKAVKKTRTDINELKSANGIYGIIINNSDDIDNIAKAISAVAYIELTDGTVIYSDVTVTSSMRIIKRVFRYTVIGAYDSGFNADTLSWSSASSIEGTALQAAFDAYAAEYEYEFTYDHLKEKIEISATTTTKDDRIAMKYILNYVIQNPTV